MTKKPSASDPRIRAKHRFIEDMAVDIRLSALGFRVGWLLVSRFWNHMSGRCDPGVDTLAGVLGVDEKTVRRGLKELIDLGHFVAKARGKGLTKLYWPSFDDRAKMSDQDRAKMSGHKSRKTGQICPDDRANLSTARTGQKCPVHKNPSKPVKEPCQEGAPTASPSLHQSLDSTSDDNDPRRRALEGSPSHASPTVTIQPGDTLSVWDDENEVLTSCRVLHIDDDGSYGTGLLEGQSTRRICFLEEPPVLMMPDDGDADAHDDWSWSATSDEGDELPPSLDISTTHTGTHDEG